MSIGQTLAQAREAAGMSLEDVSAATRVRRTLIEAMEHDDFSGCGGEFYARGHLRNVAAAVGIDPAPLVAEFDAERGGATAPAVTEIFEAEKTKKERRNGPNWTAAMAAALAVLAIIGGAQLLNRPTHAARTGPLANGVTSSRSATTTPPETTTSTPGATTPAPGGTTLAQKQGHPVTVVVTAATGACWVQVLNAAGTQLFQGTLAKGQSRTLTDNKLVKLTLGSAGHVTLVVNGKSVGSPGSPGQIVHLTFGPQDPAAA